MDRCSECLALICVANAASVATRCNLWLQCDRNVTLGPMQAVPAPLPTPDAKNHPVNTSTLPQKNPGRRVEGISFGAVGRFCRAVSSITGGLLLGSNFGVVPGIAGGFVGAVIFALAENSVRR